MAEILGLGMSHCPLMARPLGMKSIAYHLVDRPDVPDSAKDPTNWLAPMQAELGDDEGIAYARVRREAFGAECRRIRKALDAFNPDASSPGATTSMKISRKILSRPSAFSHMAT